MQQGGTPPQYIFFPRKIDIRRLFLIDSFSQQQLAQVQEYRYMYKERKQQATCRIKKHGSKKSHGPRINQIDQGALADLGRGEKI